MRILWERLNEIGTTPDLVKIRDDIKTMYNSMLSDDRFGSIEATNQAKIAKEQATIATQKTQEVSDKVATLQVENKNTADYLVETKSAISDMDKLLKNAKEIQDDITSNVQLSATQVKTATQKATSAGLYADNAKSSETSAKASEVTASDSAKSAKASEATASNSAKSASDSAKSASDSATSASSYATTASSYATTASASAKSASSYATTASNSAKSASDSAKSASDAATTASSYATTASASAKSASDSAKNAKASETTIANYKNQASVYASNAKGEADRAKAEADKVKEAIANINKGGGSGGGNTQNINLTNIVKVASWNADTGVLELEAELETDEG